MVIKKLIKGWLNNKKLFGSIVKNHGNNQIKVYSNHIQKRRKEFKNFDLNDLYKILDEDPQGKTYSSFLI
jgi:hypothetical protein